MCFRCKKATERKTVRAFSMGTNVIKRGVTVCRFTIGGQPDLHPDRRLLEFFREAAIGHVLANKYLTPLFRKFAFRLTERQNHTKMSVEPTVFIESGAPAREKNVGPLRRVWRFYRDGFRSMTFGRGLWVLVLVKLFIMFAILKVFFFPDFFRHKTVPEKQDYVGKELINRSIK